MPWLLLALAAARPHPSPTAAAHRAYRAGNYRVALGHTREALESHPDDADLFAITGIAEAGLGLYPDALIDLRLGMGSSYESTDGIGARADCLRAFGQGEEAANLRLERPLVVSGGRAELLALEGAVDDLRRAGELGQAADLVDRAQVLKPQGATVLALRADLALDTGDVDEAEWWLWLASRGGRHSLRLSLVQARLDLLMGDLQAADTDSAAARAEVPRSQQAVALRAEVLRRAGSPEDALVLLERPRWALHARTDLWAVEAMSRWDLGDRDRAVAILDHADTIYPDDPYLRFARAQLR